MQYLTYGEYLEIGGVLEETAFNRNVGRASGVIDGATKCRIEKMQSVPPQAKELCRDLVEYFANHSVTEKSVTSKSQSAGNVSESESYSIKSKAEQAQEVEAMICDYLLPLTDDNGTPLLYWGCAG